MSDILAKGLDTEAVQRDKNRNIVHQNRNIQNATDMKVMMAEIIKHFNVTDAEIHAKNAPNIEVKIGAKHNENTRKEILWALEDCTGVGYKFTVEIVDKEFEPGIAFIRGGA